MNDNKNHEQNNRHQKEESLVNGGMFNESSLESNAVILKLKEEIQELKLKLQKKTLQVVNEKAKKQVDIFGNFKEFTPVGYFKLSGDGNIKETNIYGLKILRTKSKHLINSNFKKHIASESQSDFIDFFQKLVKTNKNQHCEIKLFLNK